jgi:predicted amidohydrolase YtcJ
MTALIFVGGTIWTPTGQPGPDALLVVDGAIAALGADARGLALGFDDVDEVDLDGGFLMPSFGDGHAHPLLGGLEQAGPPVRQCTSVAEIVESIRGYAEQHRDTDWIVGASYDSSLASEGLFDARWLDAAVPDRPVLLRAWDYHTVWCNSAALQRSGIGDDTPDPELGEIVRRPDGSAMGTLREWGAVDLVLNRVPLHDHAVRVGALRAAADYYLARGVTWVQDAWVNPEDVDTYLDAAAGDALGLRFNLALYADPRHFDAQLDGYADARRRIEAASSPLLTANTVKFFADGVVENETGALLEPYCSGLHRHGGQERSDPGNNLGLQVWEGDSLAEAARRVDELGFQIHIHAIGDGAARQALDAIAHVVAHNPPRDRRPVIAHAQLVDDADIGRFAELGVIANMQPLWAQLDPLMTVLTIPRLGQDRADRQYRMNTLGRSGARLSFGSDWPVSSGAPLEGIAVAVSRQTADGTPPQGWIPGEALTVTEALTAYTAGVAEQAFADSWGTITPGASADLVWLDRDPHAVAALEIPNLRVRATYLQGTRVYP